MLFPNKTYSNDPQIDDGYSDFFEQAIDRISDELNIDPDVVQAVMDGDFSHTRAEEVETAFKQFRSGDL